MSEISSALYRAGEGEPVVLLHGFTGTWHHWRPVLGELVARYEVIAPTLAGHHGGPPFPEGAHSIAAAVDHLEAHLDDLGVGTAHFVGNSMGGAFAIELAKRGRARSAVALSPGGGWEPNGPEPLKIAKFFERTIKLTRRSAPTIPFVMRFAPLRRLSFRDAMRHGELVTPPDAAEIALTPLRCTVVDDVLETLRARSAHLTDLDQVQAPVLVAWAEKDRILPLATCAATLRNLPGGGEFRVLPKVGHVPMWDDSKLIVKTITEWVDRHTAATEPATASAAADA